ncbi:hypothetical protein [Natrialba hulunbeirensis]|uniref:hypothetical protein n=1 Tax=Natrialba hulunbeirensis TaxID=123783 RepID=UPI00135F19AA|nr:hypothetical protein [Natrialba hulunbeirensis]
MVPSDASLAQARPDRRETTQAMTAVRATARALRGRPYAPDVLHVLYVPLVNPEATE